jgi:hypothetical protein
VHVKCAESVEGAEVVTKEELEDPHQDAVATATYELLADFQRRHNFMLNPLKLYACYAEHGRKYFDLCSAMEPAHDGQELTLRLRHALRYATAAYGPVYLKGYMFSLGNTFLAQTVHKKTLSMEKQTVSDTAVATILGCPVSNIVASRWTYKVFEPCYCVVVDHERQWAVFAIRGTMSQNDVLTDVAGVVVECDGGYIHDGVNRTVEGLLKDETLLGALRSTPPSYPIVVTGHSLGAGTATVFALRALREKVFPDREVLCFAFAPPPMVSEGLAGCEVAMKSIVSLVAGVDAVPRLSMNSVERLGNSLNHSEGSMNIQTETYIVGRTLLLTDPVGKSTKMVDVPRCSSLLMSIIVAPRMFDDHMTETYAKGLDLMFSSF